jgi:hypothetical protein
VFGDLSNISDELAGDEEELKDYYGDLKCLQETLAKEAGFYALRMGRSWPVTYGTEGDYTPTGPIEEVHEGIDLRTGADWEGSYPTITGYPGVYGNSHLRGPQPDEARVGIIVKNWGDHDAWVSIQGNMFTHWKPDDMLGDYDSIVRIEYRFDVHDKFENQVYSINTETSAGVFKWYPSSHAHAGIGHFWDDASIDWTFYVPEGGHIDLRRRWRNVSGVAIPLTTLTARDFNARLVIRWQGKANESSRPW